MAAIFISHSSRDITLAEQMEKWLSDQGYERVLVDYDKHTGPQPGEHWERWLYEQIARCHAILLILTPNWLESKWCFAEFTQARALGKIIFPVVLSPLGDKRVAPEIQGVDLREWNVEGEEYLRRRLREVTDEVARGFKWNRTRSPYPGIYSFEAEDAAIFFGRDQEIRNVIERLEFRRIHGGNRMLQIIGSSGSGKSSLLKAGVLPQLNRDRSHWIPLPPFRPERTPLTAFVKSVAEKTGHPEGWREWQRLFTSSIPDALSTLEEELRIGDARNAVIVIAIDQFEEIFTVAEEDERTCILNILSATDSERRLYYQIIGTIRSDVLGQLLQSRQFTIPFEDYVLRPMPDDQIITVIEGPAGVAAVTLEKGLAQRIASDVSSSDALPLLAFALRELNERFGAKRRLSVSDYESLGRRNQGISPIQDVIRRKADDVLQSLRPNAVGLDSLRRSFIPHLVAIRDDHTFVRQTAKLEDLPSEAQPLINAFVAARLLSARSSDVYSHSDDGILIEVAHEALFQAWPLLARWLNEEREFLSGKAQLQRFLQDWTAAQGTQKKTALLQGIYLTRAMEWLKTHKDGFSADEIKFIETSRWKAWQRTMAISVAAIGFVALIAVIVLPRVYADYAFRTALDCDKFAAEPDNNVHVPGVKFDEINTGVAIPACRSAVAMEPENPRLMHNLGRSLDQAGNYAEAAEWYLRAANIGWAASKNSLGVLYLYGRGVPRNFAQGVGLIRAAAARNNADALTNYIQTDFTTLFQQFPELGGILENALASRGLITQNDILGKWSTGLAAGLELFKKNEGLTDKGISLRVLDKLGVVDQISSKFDAIQAPR
jgi:hypothetical protein